MAAFSKAVKLLVLALVVVAMARPQWVKAHVKIFSEGIDIIITLDCSTSMNAADFQPKDRITVARDVVKDFLGQRKNDRIGLVVFAREAYTQSPLTLDYRALSGIVGTLKTGVIEDGTAIGNALAVSTNRLRPAPGKSKVVVLVTDGDNNAGNIAPLEAADLAKQHGVRVFTILVGKEGPVQYPVGKDIFGRTRYEDVEFSVNPALLKQIAERTGGKAYEATDGDGLRDGIRKVLDEMEKTKFAETSSYEQIVELAPYVSFLALALLVLDLLLTLSSARRFPA
ncbi:MAG: VWA domain-containing protein [Deltaproteobacteria bacterium]|nr:VWA domain-containing protein [Deltaproteobacteria bacterium]